MLAVLNRNDSGSAQLQTCRADEFVAAVNSAIAREPFRQQWDVPLNVDPADTTDMAAARWTQQRFNADGTGYRAELSEKTWTLRVTSWTEF